MKTMASFYRISRTDGSVLLYVQNNTRIISLQKIDKGVAHIEPYTSMTFEEFANIICGCFEEKSNMFGFMKIICKWSKFEIPATSHDDVQSLKKKLDDMYHEGFKNELTSAIEGNVDTE